MLIDLRTSIYDYPGKVLWSRLRLGADGTVTGFRETRGWAPGRQLYFAHALLAAGERATSCTTPRRGLPYKGFPPPAAGRRASARRSRAGSWWAVFDFGTAAGAELIVKVAISPVSEDGRRRQPRRRSAGLGLRRACAARRRQQWSQALGRVRGRGAAGRCAAASTPRSITRSWRPSLFMDSDGRYRGPDNAVHQAEGFTNLLRPSRCGTPTAPLHPLLTLVAAAGSARNDMVRSLLRRAAERSPYGDAAGVGVPGPGDLVHDRLPRRRR